MPQHLLEVTLDEISLVDNPANELAKVILSKRAEKDVTKCGDEPCPKCAAKSCDKHMKYDDEDDVKKATAGVQFNIGFKDEGGSEVQSVIFDSSKWDKSKAKKWLEDHDFIADKIDEKENTLRYRQKDPEGYTKFRMVKPGAQVSKALRGNHSFQSIQTSIDLALREKYDRHPVIEKGMVTQPASYVWVRDLNKDTVIFDQDGQTWGTDYNVSRNDSGELVVKLGDKVPKEVVYQDVTKVQEVPGSVLSRLAKFEVSLKNTVKR